MLEADPLRILIRRFLRPTFFFSRKLDYSIVHGAEVDFSGRRTCLFSHYDKHSQLDAHVVHYIKSLKEAGLSVVLISSNMDLAEESLDLAKSICSAVILRENRGWDFGGWSLGMRVLKGIYAAEEIVFANDSVYGPMQSLSEVFDSMNKLPWPIWSITESFEVDRHLQSYFLVFKRSAIVADCFRLFWESVRIFENKLDVIAHYETKLTKFFESHKLPATAYVQHAGEFSLKNPTLDHWRATLERGKSPFIKVQLLRANPKSSDIKGWEEVVASRGYETALIHNHLCRVK